MLKPEVPRGILAEIAPNVASARGLVIALNDGEYDDKHDLMLNLGNLRTRGRAIMRAAQQAIDELGEV